MVKDIFGQARDLVPSPKVPFLEISRIPTAGISVDGVQYMSLMSVKNWGEPGKWETNYSGLAVSGDNGENWVEAPETRRPSDAGNKNFQMAAFLKDGGFVYQYGTTPGRGGNARSSLASASTTSATSANTSTGTVASGRRATSTPPLRSRAASASCPCSTTSSSAST